MANGRLTLGKQSGGTLGLVFPDGVSDTEVVLPESGNVVSVDTAVTDSAIARYDGTTGKLQNSGVIVDDSGNLLLTSGTGALGYGSGAGGTVTQLTSKSTAVALNKPSGRIVMHNAALAAGASAVFDFFNSILGPTDTVDVKGYFAGSGADPYNYRIEVKRVWNGRCTIRVDNNTDVSLSEAIALNFTVTKGSLS